MYIVCPLHLIIRMNDMLISLAWALSCCEELGTGKMYNIIKCFQLSNLHINVASRISDRACLKVFSMSALYNMLYVITSYS